MRRRLSSAREPLSLRDRTDSELSELRVPVDNVRLGSSLNASTRGSLSHSNIAPGNGSTLAAKPATTAFATTYEHIGARGRTISLQEINHARPLSSPVTVGHSRPLESRTSGASSESQADKSSERAFKKGGEALLGGKVVKDGPTAGDEVLAEVRGNLAALPRPPPLLTRLPSTGSQGGTLPVIMEDSPPVTPQGFASPTHKMFQARVFSANRTRVSSVATNSSMGDVVMCEPTPFVEVHGAITRGGSDPDVRQYDPTSPGMSMPWGDRVPAGSGDFMSSLLFQSQDDSQASLAGTNSPRVTRARQLFSRRLAAQGMTATGLSAGANQTAGQPRCHRSLAHEIAVVERERSAPAGHHLLQRRASLSVYPSPGPAQFPAPSFDFAQPSGEGFTSPTFGVCATPRNAGRRSDPKSGGSLADGSLKEEFAPQVSSHALAALFQHEDRCTDRACTQCHHGPARMRRPSIQSNEQPVMKRARPGRANSVTTPGPELALPDSLPSSVAMSSEGHDSNPLLQGPMKTQRQVRIRKRHSAQQQRLDLADEPETTSAPDQDLRGVRRRSLRRRRSRSLRHENVVLRAARLGALNNDNDGDIGGVVPTAVRGEVGSPGAPGRGGTDAMLECSPGHEDSCNTERRRTEAASRREWRQKRPYRRPRRRRLTDSEPALTGSSVPGFPTGLSTSSDESDSASNHL